MWSVLGELLICVCVYVCVCVWSVLGELLCMD